MFNIGRDLKKGQVDTVEKGDGIPKRLVEDIGSDMGLGFSVLRTLAEI